MAKKEEIKEEVKEEINKNEVSIEFLNEMPFRAYEEAAGFDLVSSRSIEIPVGKSGSVPTKVSCKIPSGYVGLVRGRSGNLMRGLFVGEGTVDSDYTGEIRVALYNLGDCTKLIKAGDRVAQLVVVPCLTEVKVVKELPQTTRGSSGFGSTGK